MLRAIERPPLWARGPRALAGAATAAWPVLVTVVVLTAARCLLPLVVQEPVANLAGLALALVVPSVLLRSKVDWPVAGVAQAWVLAVITTVLALLLVGLGLNYLLPLVGVDRPLDPVPVVTSVVVLQVLLALWRPERRPTRAAWRSWFEVARRPTWGRRLVSASVVALLISVVGAVRLNNGASGTVALVALVVWIVIIGVLLFGVDRFGLGSRLTVVYLLAAAFLLMTSLRGWYVTGHDIQYEYQVFELTSNLGRWSPYDFRSAYYACLSITVLPTLLAHLTGWSGVVVFKVVIQLLFALCPVMVLLICRKVVPERLALLGIVYFLLFPTFFSDMPFLARQEMAFLFFAGAILLLRDDDGRRRSRLVWALAFGVGMILTHYSTNYVFLATLLGAWLVRLLLRPVLALVGRLPFARPARLTAPTRPLLGAAVLLPLVVATLVWTGPVTQSGGQVAKTFTAVADAFTPGNSAARSSDTAYSIFSPSEVSPDEKFAAFVAAEQAERAAVGTDDYLYPAASVEQYPTQRYQTPELAYTDVGRAMDRLGLSPSAFNGLLRSAIAGALQLFIAIGLVLILLGRFVTRPLNREYVSLGIAAFGVVVAQVVLPAISVDYGVLRAFQQSLITLAPILAIGNVALFTLVFRRRAYQASVVVALASALSLTGVIPQTLGGYPVQLHLNNAGQYYDVYYTHPEEVSALDWLNTAEAGVAVKAEVSSDRYTSARLQNFTGTKPLNAMYPTELRRRSFVVVGTTTVRADTVATFFEGDLLSYRYPMAVLDDNKSLIYASGGARIYR